jgi:hypothetical protein
VVASGKIAVLWDFESFILVEVYGRFDGAYCLCHQSCKTSINYANT